MDAYLEVSACPGHKGTCTRTIVGTNSKTEEFFYMYNNTTLITALSKVLATRRSEHLQKLNTSDFSWPKGVPN